MDKFDTLKTGWHFLKEDCCLGYGDGRKVVVGETLTVDCEPILCQSGLHASERIIDALYYARGPVCSLVEVGGNIVFGDDKFAGMTRKTLWMQDISELLHNFACDVAEQALLKMRNAGEEPDPLCFAAIEAKRKWLKGDTTDDELEAAELAAWSAAELAAWSAAEVAALAAQNDELEKRALALMKTTND